MRIRQRAGESTVVLELTGRWLLGEVETRLVEVVQACLNEGRTRIVLDCTEISYVDSSGLGDLVASYVAVSAKGGRLELVGVGPRFRRLLSTVGLLAVLPLSDALSGGGATGSGPIPGALGDAFTPSCGPGWGSRPCPAC